MNHRNWFITMTAILGIILLVTSTMFAGVSPTSPIIKPAQAQQFPAEMRNWEYVNKDLAASNYNPQTQINADNVEFLELKWMWPFPERSIYANNMPGLGFQLGSDQPPLLVDGIAYLADNAQNVHAINAQTGKTIWSNEYKVDIDAALSRLPLVQSAGSIHYHAFNYFDGKLVVPGAACSMRGVNALTGSTDWELLDICSNIDNNYYSNAAGGDYVGQGLYRASLASHPPSLYKNIMVTVQAGGDGATGGRSFVAGYNINTNPPTQVWQTYFSPPAEGDPDWALHNCSKGWFFSESAWQNEGRLGLPCTEVLDACRECLVNDWGVPTHWGASTSATWGHIALDEETGIAYFGTGNPTPVTNQTGVPGDGQLNCVGCGPNLYGGSVVAVDAQTGEMVWWYQMHPHGVYSNDCAWSTMLIETKIDGRMRKVIKKGCKPGAMTAILDAANGEPLRIFRTPHHIAMGAPTEHSASKDPRSLEQMSMRWCGDWEGYRSPVKAGDYCLVSPDRGLYTDDAFDGETLYMVSVGEVRYQGVGTYVNHLTRIGGRSNINPPGFTANHTVYAWDIDANKPIWSHFIDGVAARGSVIASGGVVYWAAANGYLYGYDAKTGEVLFQKFHAQQLGHPIIGMDANGDTILMAIVGGKTTGAASQAGWRAVPGALVAYGLPDNIQTIVEERVVERSVRVEVPGPERVVEVEKVIEVDRVVEVVREVPGPTKIVEKEVIKEVPVEVEVVRDREVISPISYVTIGLGVVLIIVSAVLFTRGRTKT